MKRYLIFFMFMLASCASNKAYQTQTYFIDSNVSASVYCDDEFLGTTPMKVKTSLTCKMTLEKEGYKSPSFRFANLKEYHYQEFPSEKIKRNHGLLMDYIPFIKIKKDYTLDFIEYIIRNDLPCLDDMEMTKLRLNFRRSLKGCSISIYEEMMYLWDREDHPMITTNLTNPTFVGGVIIDGLLLVSEGVLDVLALPIDGVTTTMHPINNTAEYSKVSSQNSSVTSYNMTSIDIVIPYDHDSYFFELIPKNKKSFTQHDLDELRTKLFVLKNFNELKFASPEYVRTMVALTGKPFILPAPQDNPGDYFRTLKHKNEALTDI